MLWFPIVHHVMWTISWHSRESLLCVPLSLEALQIVASTSVLLLFVIKSSVLTAHSYYLELYNMQPPFCASFFALFISSVLKLHFFFFPALLHFLSPSLHECIWSMFSASLRKPLLLLCKTKRYWNVDLRNSVMKYLVYTVGWGARLSALMKWSPGLWTWGHSVLKSNSAVSCHYSTHSYHCRWSQHYKLYRGTSVHFQNPLTYLCTLFKKVTMYCKNKYQRLMHCTRV